MRFQDEAAVDAAAGTTPETVNEVSQNATQATKAAGDAKDALVSGDVNALGTALQSLIDASIPILLNLLGGLVILVLAFIVAGWFAKIIRGGMAKAKVDTTLASFFGQMGYWLIIIIGIIAAIGRIGIPTASFVAVLGGASLAIGLAFQGSLGNLASGVMLLLFRPMRVGDVISTAGITAKVHEIGLFATTFDTPDNRRFIVPNGAIFGSTIENISHHTLRRADVAVGTEYGADLDQTRAVLEACAESVEGTIAEPAPVVYLNELGDSAISWTVRVWCNAPDYWAVRERATRDVKVALDKAGIGIPFPQMDVHLNKLGA